MQPMSNLPAGRRGGWSGQPAGHGCGCELESVTGSHASVVICARKIATASALFSKREIINGDALVDLCVCVVSI